MEGGDRVTREKREKRLYEASLSGNVESLTKLMQKDELSLTRVTVTCFNETPLHIAAMLGHVEFAKALVKYNSSLVSELDLQGRTPLHLASANGYVEMVKLLLGVDPNVCKVQDEDGRTPLHLAAMKGRVEVLNELTRFRPEVIRYKLRQGETILHSCVICNRLEALKQLMELRGVDGDFVNAQDNYGDTILHRATAMKQVETVKYLVSRADVSVNTMNKNGFTALYIIQQMPRDLKTIEIHELLDNAGANNIPSMARDSQQSVRSNNMDKNWFEKMQNSILVAATVIAAMAYQAGLNPPCGVWQDDESYKYKDGGETIFDAGTSVMAVKYPTLYGLFWKFNTISFFASLSIIIVLVCGLHLRRRMFMWGLIAAICVTITFMGLAYIVAMVAITPYNEGFEHEWFTTINIVKISLFGLSGVFFIVFCGYAFKLFRWIMRVSRNANAVQRGQSQNNV